MCLEVQRSVIWCEDILFFISMCCCLTVQHLYLLVHNIPLVSFVFWVLSFKNCSSL